MYQSGVTIHSIKSTGQEALHISDIDSPENQEWNLIFEALGHYKSKLYPLSENWQPDDFTVPVK